MKDSLLVDVILKSQPIFIEGKLVECKIAIPKDHIQESYNSQKGVNCNSKMNIPLPNNSKINCIIKINKFFLKFNNKL